MPIREGMPIPNDWDEETDGYTLWMLCSPNSVQWRALVRGQIYELTRGRNWDRNTGIIKDAQEIGLEVYDSMATCNDLVKTQRMLVASITGQPVDLDADLPTGVYDPAGRSLHEHLQSLGPIPKAGDTIMTSLQKLVDASGGSDLDLDGLIDVIENLDLGGTDFVDDLQDWLAVASYLKLLFGNVPISRAFTTWQWFTMSRWQHNNLTLQSYQATALRGIQRAIAPFDEDDQADPEGDLLDKLGAVPWLARAVVAIAEPGPLGETWLLTGAVKGAIAGFFGTIRSAWELFYNKWINQTGTPVPRDTVVGSLLDLSGRLAAITDAGDHPEYANDNIGTILQAIQTGLTALGTGELSEIADNIAGLDLVCTCGANGGPGCGCGPIGEGVTPPAGPGEEGGTPPEGYEQPSDPQNPTGPPITPGTPAYDDRKCLVANLQHDNIKQFAQKAIDLGIEDVLNSGMPYVIMYGILATLILAALGELLTPVPILDALVFGIIGLMSTIILAITGNDTNFTTMVAAMTAHEEDLVCALYSATTPEEARTDYLNVLHTQAGLNTGETVWLAIILTADYLNTLFFDPISIGGFAEELAGYTPSVDCGVCSPVWWDCGFGNTISYDAFGAEIEGVQAGDGMYMVSIGVDSALNLSASQVGWSAPSVEPSFATAYDTSENRCNSGNGSPWTVQSASFLTGPNVCYGRLYRSETPFTVTYTIN